MPRLNVEVKDPLYSNAQEEASALGLSLSEVVRSLMVKWVAKARRERLELRQLGDDDDEVKDVG